jgi:hypothetical protein
MKKRKRKASTCPDIDPKDGWPLREGVYAIEPYVDGPSEIDVYKHPVKGLCCYADDFGSGGNGLEFGEHVSVQFTGLKFLRRLRDFDT